jgi:hypothetical protein
MNVVRPPHLFAVVFIVLTLPLFVSAQSPLQFIPLTPCRIVDTRITGQPIQGGTAQNFAIQGSCGVPQSAAAYSLNVTVIPYGTLDYLTVWPTGQNQPVVSTLNSFDGRVKANAAIVGAGSIGGEVSVYASNTTDLVLDLDGYFAPISGSTMAFYPLIPCRVADTRQGHYLHGGQEADFPVSGVCTVPSSAAAYSLNFTAVPHGPLGYLTAWPTGQPKPLVSTLNDLTGTIVANAAMVEAGTSGEVAVYPSNDTDLVIDIDGYYAQANSAPGGLSLYTLTPCRLLDTRQTTGAFVGTLPVNTLVSSCDVPSLAQAVVANATVLPQGPSLAYLTLWPNGQIQPLASTLNALDGAVTSNMAVTPTSNGFVNAYATNSTQLLLDVSSYFALPSGLDGNYTFSVDGYNSGGPVLMAGSFVADGNGSITGVLDENSAGGAPSANVAFTGTYSIQSSGLGTMSMTLPLGTPFHFSIAISSTGNGRLVLNSDSNQKIWSSGVIRKQDPAALSLQQITGNFASGFSGVDPGLNRFAGAGVYQITPTGNVTGSSDTNDNGVLKSPPTSGVLLTLDPRTGRGTAALVTSGKLTHWVYYVTSANDLTFLSIDPITSPTNLVMQTMLRQANLTFGNGSLNGVGVVRTTGISQTGDKRKQQVPGSSVPDVVVGLLTTDGNGNGSTSLDENVGGTLTQQQTSQGTYSVAANGRVTLTGFGSNTPPFLYLVDRNQAFLVGQDSSVSSGYVVPQSGGPFSNASAIGTYWGGSVMPVTSAVTDSVTWAFSDGNGNLNGTTDTSGSGGPGSQNFSGTLLVDSTGRIILNENGSLAAILYVISPTRVVLLPATDPNPALSVLGSTN